MHKLHCLQTRLSTPPGPEMLLKGGCLLLQVMRDDNARAAVTSKHSYAVQVAPGTDCVLMITAAMAIEDIYHA